MYLTLSRTAIWTSGQSLYLKPLSEFLHVASIPESSKARNIYILKFYKLVNGKKIFIWQERRTSGQTHY